MAPRFRARLLWIGFAIVPMWSEVYRSIRIFHKNAVKLMTLLDLLPKLQLLPVAEVVNDSYIKLSDPFKFPLKIVSD